MQFKSSGHIHTLTVPPACPFPVKGLRQDMPAFHHTFWLCAYLWTYRRDAFTCAIFIPGSFLFLLPSFHFCHTPALTPLRTILSLFISCLFCSTTRQETISSWTWFAGSREKAM